MVDMVVEEEEIFNSNLPHMVEDHSMDTHNKVVDIEVEEEDKGAKGTAGPSAGGGGKGLFPSWVK